MSVTAIPEIAPVEVLDLKRPRWSVVIPTYDCASYLGPCLESVLGQLGDPGFAEDDVEIIVVDDRSGDEPERVVAEVGGGRVRFTRNPVNLGAIGNFNACLREARGEFVHLLHGDDLSSPGFYNSAGTVFDTHDDVGTFVARATYVDEQGVLAETTRSEVTPSGRWGDVVDVLVVSNRIRPPAVAMRRQVIEQVGGFRSDLPHAADWEMWARLAAAQPVWFEDRSLARYRRHSSSDTAARVLTAENVRERLRCIEIIATHLPEPRRRRQKRRGYAYSALFAARTALRLARTRSWGGALRQLRAAGASLVAAIRGEAHEKVGKGV